MITITVILFAVGLYAVKMIVAVPAAIIEASAMFLYVNLAHFIYGIGRIIYYVSKIRPLGEKVSIKRSFISIILSPVNALILYIALIFIALSSCAA
jgi:hypothetical protein